MIRPAQCKRPIAVKFPSRPSGPFFSTSRRISRQQVAAFHLSRSLRLRGGLSVYKVKRRLRRVRTRYPRASPTALQRCFLFYRPDVVATSIDGLRTFSFLILSSSSRASVCIRPSSRILREHLFSVPYLKPATACCFGVLGGHSPLRYGGA